MRRIGIAVWVSLVIVFAGLPAGVQAQGGDDVVVAEWHFEEGSGGVLEEIKVSFGQYFITPVDAVMECLKQQGEEPDRCSPVRIADETGVPLEVIRGLLG